MYLYFHCTSAQTIMMKLTFLVIIMITDVLISAYELRALSYPPPQLYYIPSTGQYVWSRKDPTMATNLINIPQPSTPKPFEFENDECGIRNIDESLYKQRRAKIVGGSEPLYGAFPWQVEIQRFSYVSGKKIWNHHCGGALIKRNIVLTAAHCMKNGEDTFKLSHLRVIVGEHNILKRDASEKIVYIANLVLHPSFRKNGSYSNDIAVIQLREKVQYTSHVQPICLPEVNKGPKAGAWCDVSGWGMLDTDDTESLATTLQAITVPIIETKLCRTDKYYGGRQQQILDSMLCAGLQKGGQDACGGDSGGPMACESNGRFYLGGLISWGDGCAKEYRPGVYTRVDYFTPWIEQTINKLNKNC